MDHSTCHHVSPTIEKSADDGVFESVCSVLTCCALVFYEPFDEDVEDDISLAWLGAAIDHCGYTSEQEEQLRFMLALGGRASAASLMGEFDAQRCPTGGEGCL